ncbi:MAG: glycosyltransferase family protein [Candidatus Nanoarchaeia archaeon]
MNVLFVVTGVGYGDSIRSHAVIKALLKRNPKTRIMVAGYDNSYNYFKDKYPTIKISGYKLLGMSLKFRVLSFIANNYVLPYTWFSVSLKLKKAVKSFKPDVIISDFEPAGIILGRMLRRPSVVIFAYDPLLFKYYKHKNKKLILESIYFQKLYSLADVTIIPNLLGMKKSNEYVYVNPVVITKPSELPSERVLMRKLKLKKRPVLVMLGGSSFGVNLARRLMRVVKNFDEDFIIFGSNVKLPRRKNVKHFLFKPNFVEYLKVCKGVITLAGNLTLSECVVFRKPMLVFPIKDHVEQTLNAYALHNIAMVKYDIKGLRRSVESFLKNLNSIKRKIPVVEPSGAEEIAGIIRSLK